jgi:CP family cyanate transporter-like MFS transporter
VRQAEPRSLWAGRTAAVLGILLIALNMRTAVAAISPIVALVSKDIPLDSIGLGVLGTLPPIAFAASGLLAPLLARRIGLEATLVLACLAMIVGPLVRAVAPNYAVLLVGSAITLAGMGFGNIMLPPAVKKYFPDRIGQLTAAYATLVSISISVPALIATPVAAASGWRVSVGSWAVLAACALVPWVVVRLHAGRVAARERAENLVPEPRADLLNGMRHSRTAIALAITFAVVALNTYAFFAWLPELLRERAGSSAAEAGAMLFVFGIVGLPLGLLAPILASRVRNVGYLIGVGVVLFVVGYLGLLVVPTVLTWLWVLLTGAGAILFPLCLALIALRARGPDGAVALSGFVQAIGYAAGALGPLLFGILHDATGGWTVPLLFLVATSLVAIVPAFLLRRPTFVEDEL